MREERVGLEHHRDVAIGRRETGDIAVADGDLAGGRHFETGNHAERRGLATAGGAEEGDEFARFDMEVDVVHRLDVLAEDLGNAFEADWCGL